MIKLNNTGPVDCIVKNLYFPRLQVNKRGEIVLAISKSKKYGLTKGILVGKTKDSTSKLDIGTKITDWEVCGELTDYNGEVSVSFKNMVNV